MLFFRSKIPYRTSGSLSSFKQELFWVKAALLDSPEGAPCHTCAGVRFASHPQLSAVIFSWCGWWRFVGQWFLTVLFRSQFKYHFLREVSQYSGYLCPGCHHYTLASQLTTSCCNYMPPVLCLCQICDLTRDHSACSPLSFPAPRINTGWHKESSWQITFWVNR